MQSVSSTPGSGAHIGLNQTALIYVDMGEAIKVTGSPTLTLSDGETATYSSAQSNAAAGVMAFTYKAGPGHTTADLQVSSINIGTGVSVIDLAGNAANFSGLSGKGKIGLVVDTAPPIIDTISVKSPPASGRVPLGQKIEIDLTANEPLAVSGPPTLTLNDGGTASYDAAHSNLAGGIVAFDYTPLAGQNIADLMVKSLTVSKGSTIADLAGNPIIVAGAANKNLAVAVDTSAPTVVALDEFTSSSLTTPVATGAAFHLNDTFYFKATVKDATAGDSLQVTPDFSLVLNDGAKANYDAAASNQAGNVLVFKYMVGNESTTDLKAVGLDFSGGGSATDLAGNPLVLATNLVDHKNTVNVFTWTNKSGGAFGLGSNWNPAAPPQPGNAAEITLPGTYTVTTAEATLVGTLDIVKGVTLSVAAATEVDMTLGGSNSGIINVGAAGTFAVGSGDGASVFVNKGTITLNDVGAAAFTAFGSGGALTLSGGGSVNLGSNGQGAIGNAANADASLTNVDNKILGAGVIGVNPVGGTFVLDNQAKGLINGNGTAAPLLIFLDAAVTNEGVLEGTSPQGLVIDGDGHAMTNSNLIEALGTNAKTVIQDGATIANTGKGVILASGTNAHVNLFGGAIIGGTLKATGTGATINIGHDVDNPATEFDGSGVGLPVNVAAPVNVDDGGQLTLAGTINNTGKITLDTGAGAAGAKLAISDAHPVTLNGTGSIILANAFDHVTSTNAATSLTNNGNTISGVGSIGDNLTDITNSKGIIAANVSGGELDITAHTFHNAATIEATNGGTLILHSDITNTSSSAMIKTLSAEANIDLDGVTIAGGKVSIVKNSFFDSTGASSPSTIDAPVTNAGRLGAEGNDLTVNGAVNNTGVLDANNGNQLTVHGVVTGAGMATVENGGTIKFDFASSATFSFATGADGTLVLEFATNAANKFTGTISGFAHSDDIDLGAINYTTGDAQITGYTHTATSGTLTVTDGVHTEGLTFSGASFASLTAADFTIHDDTILHPAALHHVDILLV